jgi:L-seryl-tRNA(Ser) seleniumtransferase
MSRLQALGVPPLINAAGAYTMFGGSRLAPGVPEAMAEAGNVFLDLDLLQRRVGARIAELTGNEACFVSSGAAAGVAIAVAACVAGTDPAAIGAFPVRGERDVVVQVTQRNGYDYSARMTGVRLVEIGGSDGTTAAELRLAIGPQTACVLVFAGTFYEPGALPLHDVIEVAHAAGVPVVVDAAGQVPPVSNLRRYTVLEDADLAIFSGGKALRGPQTTGLVLGRADLIEACLANANPGHSIGRPMKVGKEELLGILAAIEWAVAMDEPAHLRTCEAIVAGWLAGFDDIPEVTVTREARGVVGEPLPQVFVRLRSGGSAARDALMDALRHGSPGVATRPSGADTIAFNPMFVEPDEAPLVARRLREEIARMAPVDD